MTDGLALAQEYHRHLPQRIRNYLHEARGISDPVIGRHLLGWNGSRITIPIFDRHGRLAFFKLAKDPEHKTDSPKMLATPGADRKSTRLNSSHSQISYAVFCLKKKNPTADYGSPS